MTAVMIASVMTAVIERSWSHHGMSGRRVDVVGHLVVLVADRERAGRLGQPLTVAGLAALGTAANLRNQLRGHTGLSPSACRRFGPAA
jgi:hypothetical protein